MTQSISQAIADLRQLTQVSVQSNWQYCDRAWAINQLDQGDWAIAELNDKQHIAWEKGQKLRWLRQVIIVPADLQDYPLQGLSLRIALTWWAEAAQVFVNGTLVQEGDLFDCRMRLLLSDAVVPGEEITIVLRLVSPGHDDGALMQSVCLYESLNSFPEPSFVADELEVLQLFLQSFDPEKLDVLESAIAQINWSALLDREQFDRSLSEVRDRLLPFSQLIKQRQIKMVGHAHLDMAWLWTVEETWKAAERTFESVLKLQEDFPELIFCHTTPALYEWMELNRPELFDRIRQQIQAGKWEALGGMWVEPELNLISGESIARHILYGQRYFQEKFGQISPIAWLPDTFGFNWQLPQFLKLGGMKYFVTQKLRWNDTTQFPHELFWWQAPDGSRVLSLMSAPIGEGIDPIKMATYACDWETKTGIPISLWLPGVGDHGGGPTRDMLEVARRWARSPFFPRIEFTTALDYLQHLESNYGEDLPVWNSELYLEFHRGCYTTHGGQKERNQKCETLLYQAELWSSLATITSGSSYPRANLELAWKKALFNQFHDILPGSSIGKVYSEANREWNEVGYICYKVKSTALASVSQQIALPVPPHPAAQPVIVFNSLTWSQSQFISLPYYLKLPYLSVGESELRWQICDLDGQVTKVQYCSELPSLLPLSPSERAREREDGSPISYPSSRFSFMGEDIPAAGYRCFWLSPHPPKSLKVEPTPEPEPDPVSIENEYLRVSIDPATGHLASIFDKLRQREILSGLGNQLQAFYDRDQYWDAWNINPEYEKYPLPPSEYYPPQYTVSKASINAYCRIGQSTFRYVYSLKEDALQILMDITWLERHVVLKAAFPLNLEAEYATYGIANGSIQRTTSPQNNYEKAQWEVPGLGWADLSDGNYGVSLISNCKYGYDSQPSQLRLTLLRGSEFPDPSADHRMHEFAYVLHPHAGDWRSARTVRIVHELNQPLQVIRLPSGLSGSRKLAPVGSFLDLGAENLILTAFKQSEDDPNQWVLRCYECHGEEAELSLQSDLGLELIEEIDLLERPIAKIQGRSVKIKPWTIASFKVIVSSQL